MNNLHTIIILLLISTVHFNIAYSFEVNCRTIYNKYDVSTELQKIIDSGATKIIIPNMPTSSKWISGPLFLKNKKNIELIFEAGVVLETKQGSFKNMETSFVNIINCENIKIIGENAEIRMLKEEYHDGQWRHGLNIISSDSVTISGLKISNTGGDGIYIGSWNTLFPCKNIQINNVITDHNARNGMSIISCINLIVENSSFINTGYKNNKGLAHNGPWAGIDFEPNHSYEKLDNIVVKNCIFSNNKRDGILFAKGSDTCSITITNNQFENNKLSGISLKGLTSGRGGKISMYGNTISGKQPYGLLFIDWNLTNIAVEYENTIIDCKSIDKPIYFLISRENKEPNKYGRISINEIHLYNNEKKECLAYLEGENSTHIFEDINISGYSNNLPIRDSYLSTLDINKHLKSYNYLDGYKVTNYSYNSSFCKLDKELKIAAYPTIFENILYIEVNTYNEIEISIVNSEGKEISIIKGKNIKELDCSPLQKGTYILKVRDVINNTVTGTKVFKI